MKDGRNLPSYLFYIQLPNRVEVARFVPRPLNGARSEFAHGMMAARLVVVMANKNGSTKRYDENFKSAAADFVKRNGRNVEQSAAELGVDATDLRQWTEEFGRDSKSPKSLSAMAKLRAENETLRNQVLQLQMQWDILKTTLGVLSTTVSTREAM
jgi:transposase-like protein